MIIYYVKGEELHIVTRQFEMFLFDLKYFRQVISRLIGGTFGTSSFWSDRP